MPMLYEVVAALSTERRGQLTYINVRWHEGAAAATLRYSVTPREEHETISQDEPMDAQIRALAESGLVGRVDAKRLDYGGEGVRAGYWPVAWNIVPWHTARERKPMGRPLQHAPGSRRRVTLELPADLLSRIEERGQTTLTDYITAAIAERLERES